MRVVYVVNAVGPTSGPATHARALARHEDVDAEILAWFGADDCAVADAIPVHCVDAPDTTLGVDVATLREAAAVLRGADLVHLHHPHSAGLASLICAVQRTPTVYTAGTVFGRYSRLGRLMAGLSGRLSSAITSVSPTVSRSRTLLDRVLGGRNRVVYTGVDLAFIDSVDGPPPVEPEGFTIATAGRIIAEKNISALVESLPYVDDATLVVAGDGDTDRLAEAADRHGVRGRLVLLGEQPREAVIRLFRAADVAAFPSFAEGFATAPLEAMAVGTPTILSRIPAFTEPFPATTTTFADPAQISSVATAISRYQDDAGRRERIGQRGREYVREHYSMAETAREYAALYEEVTA